MKSGSQSDQAGSENRALSHKRSGHAGEGSKSDLAKFGLFRIALYRVPTAATFEVQKLTAELTKARRHHSHTSPLRPMRGVVGSTAERRRSTER